MTEDETKAAKEIEMVEDVTRAIEDFLTRLTTEAGVPIPVVLAAAHAQTAAMMAAVYGAEAASLRMTHAALAIADAGRAPDFNLASAQPVGRA